MFFYFKLYLKKAKSLYDRIAEKTNWIYKN